MNDVGYRSVLYTHWVVYMCSHALFAENNKLPPTHDFQSRKDSDVTCPFKWHQNLCCDSILSPEHVLILSQLTMPYRKLTNAQRWVALGQVRVGQSARQVAQQYGIHYTAISRLVQWENETGHVKDRPRSERPVWTTQQEDNFIATTVARNRFTTDEF